MPAVVRIHATVRIRGHHFADDQVVPLAIVRNHLALHPRDAAGQHRHVDVLRGERFEVEGRELVEFRAGVRAHRQRLRGESAARQLQPEHAARLDQLPRERAAVHHDDYLRRIEIERHRPRCRHHVRAAAVRAGNDRDRSMIQQLRRPRQRHGFSCDFHTSFPLQRDEGDCSEAARSGAGKRRRPGAQAESRAIKAGIQNEDAGRQPGSAAAQARINVALYRWVRRPAVCAVPRPGRGRKRSRQRVRLEPRWPRPGPTAIRRRLPPRDRRSGRASA